jgi:hypothetical protein
VPIQFSFAARCSVATPTTPSQRRRIEWLLSHPVVGSLAAGGAWGLLFGIAASAIYGWPLVWTVVVAVGVGVCLFGPLMVLGVRRKFGTLS